MRILVVTQRNSGVGYHRLMLPIFYMEKSYAMFTDVINDEVLNENFDIVYINRYIHNTSVNQLIEYKKKYSFKLVVDIDDYWHLDAWHIIADRYPTQAVIDHIKAADQITCTNELLYNEIKQLNKNVEILENALPYGKDQFTDERIYNDKTTITHTGSITHHKDITILRNPIKRIWSDSQLKQNTKFVICGYDDRNDYTKEIWSQMISDYTNGLRLNATIRKAMPVETYMNFYNDADILLVPLIGSKFNSMKSNLKVLEASAKKIPVVASNVSPYDKCPIVHINNQSDWYKKIKRLVNDTIYRQDIGITCYEWCKENYHLDKVNIKRNQLLKSII